MPSNCTKTKDVAGQIITPIDRGMRWPDAWKEAKPLGGLPSNRLHDHYLVETEKWRELPSSYYGGWAREVVIYSPGKNVVFKKGLDAIDGTLVFPASQIPEELFKRQEQGNHAGLIVDPVDIETKNGRTVILAMPKNVTILGNFMKTDGWGKVDDETRMPVEANLDDVPKELQRYLWRINDEKKQGMIIRPVARWYYANVYDGRRGVLVEMWPNIIFGVAGTAEADREAAAPQYV